VIILRKFLPSDLSHYRAGVIICLDQCAISQLAKAAAAGGPIHELRNTLREAAGKLQAICPVAKETLIETTGLTSQEQRRSIYELHCELADARLGGPVWSFKDMWKMIDEETLALARSEPSPTAFELVDWRRIDDDQLAEKTWSTIVTSKQRMIERVQAHQLLPAEGKPAFDVTSKGAVLAVEHASHVYRQISRLLAGEALDPSDHMGYNLALYLQEQRISRSELEKLIQDILHHRWEAIPIIFNRTQITGRLEADFRREKTPRKYDVNDEFDVSRIAVGLSSADLIMTDAAMAQLCRSAKIERWTSTKVFAIRDAGEIVDFLRESLAEE